MNLKNSIKAYLTRLIIILDYLKNACISEQKYSLHIYRPVYILTYL